MNDLDMLVFRLCSQLRDQGIALEAARQEVTSLKAKVADLEAKAGPKSEKRG